MYISFFLQNLKHIVYFTSTMQVRVGNNLMMSY